MSKSLLKFIRLSPTKARLVAKKIQGMNAEYAIASLDFTPNKAAKIISKVVTSALANSNLDASQAVITSCRVDKAPVLKRFMPRARGSAYKIRKPMSHIFVSVESIKDVKTSDNKNKDKKDEKKGNK